MSGEPSIPPAPISAASSTSSLWDRLTDFASRHRRTIIYTTVTATFIIGAGGIWYYVQQQGEKDKDTEGKRKREKSSKKKKGKQNVVNDEENQIEQKPNGTIPWRKSKLTAGEVPPSPAVQEEKESLPEITDEIVKTLSPEVLFLQIL